jgi:hypothetical protein
MFLDEKSDDKNPFLSGKKNQLANTEFQADYEKVKRKSNISRNKSKIRNQTCALRNACSHSKSKPRITVETSTAKNVIAVKIQFCSDSQKKPNWE